MFNRHAEPDAHTKASAGIRFYRAAPSDFSGVHVVRGPGSHIRRGNNINMNQGARRELNIRLEIHAVSAFIKHQALMKLSGIVFRESDAVFSINPGLTSSGAKRFSGGSGWNRREFGYT